MKKINANVFVFIFCALFVLYGIASPDFYSSLKESLSEAIKSEETEESQQQSKADMLIAACETVYSNDLTYHDMLMNIHSVEYKLSNTSVIKKDDSTVLRLDNDYLAYKSEYVSREDFEYAASNIKALNDYCDDLGVGFLYVKAPSKGENVKAPDSAFDYRYENTRLFDEILDEYDICSLKLNQVMEQQGITEDEAFFVTDHHWKPETALWAVGEVCQKLNTEYGFEYNEAYTDISNYNVKTYSDYFLGSAGKKVGLYFTKYAADDFSVITPKFDTQFTMTVPQKNVLKSGSFEEALLYKENLVKDYYNINCYATYSGGDYKIQIFDNELIDEKNGDTILIIRDSFGCAFTPFLSLNADKIYSVDIRNTVTAYPRVESIRSYIKEIDADYVIVLYNGVSLFTDQVEFN